MYYIPISLLENSTFIRNAESAGDRNIPPPAVDFFSTHVRGAHATLSSTLLLSFFHCTRSSPSLPSGSRAMAPPGWPPVRARWPRHGRPPLRLHGPAPPLIRSFQLPPATAAPRSAAAATPRARARRQRPCTARAHPRPRPRSPSMLSWLRSPTLHLDGDEEVERRSKGAAARRIWGGRR